MPPPPPPPPPPAPLAAEQRATSTASAASVSSVSSAATVNTGSSYTFSGTGNAGGGDSVLSQKVSRALEVRTDTPSMLAALDALAELPSHQCSKSASQTGNKEKEMRQEMKEMHSIDPRSIRQAIEVDALTQAKLYQKELTNLVATVRDLRGKIGSVAEAAKKVKGEMERDVVELSLRDGHHGHGHGHGHGGGHGCTEHYNAEEAQEDPLISALRGEEFAQPLPHNLSVTPVYSSNPLSAEQRLASLLSSAFANRREAQIRADTVSEFLDKFDLGREETDLLDQYQFDEFDDSWTGGGAGGRREEEKEDGGGKGMAFLDALEHLRRIRTELVHTFHLDGSGSGTSTGGSAGEEKDGAGLGLSSALRMMDTLSERQERSYEKLYHFLTDYLDLHSRSVSNVPTSSSAKGPSGGTGASGPLGGGTSMDEDTLDETLRHPFVVRSLQVLRHKPRYHAHTLELIAASRRALVTRKFLLALTSGYDGLPPIEMGAHDPVQYVGDMLAFVFRVESEEADLAAGLGMSPRKVTEGGGDEGGDDGGEGEENKAEEDITEQPQDEFGEENGEDRPMSASAVLSHATSGISRPLKSRIVQVVSSLARHRTGSPDDDFGGSAASASEIGGHGPDGTLTAHDLDEEAGTARNHLAQLYEICGLLLYYRSAFHKTMARLVKASGGSARRASVNQQGDVDDNALLQCIQECLDEAASDYGASLRVYSATLPNLASLSNESEAVLIQGTVGKICDIRMGSPGFFASTDQEGRPMAGDDNASSKLHALSLEFLIDTTIDAAMSHCDRLDDAVALRNAVLTAKKAGLDGTNATNWDQAISVQERNLADSLIDGETRRVVEDIGLAPVADALQDMEAVFVEGMIIASHPGLAPQDVQVAMKDFYDSLYSPPLPSFDMIRDPVLRKYARTKTAENVVQLYGKIYDTLRSVRGGYDDLSFLAHDPSQVKTLLSL